MVPIAGILGAMAALGRRAGGLAAMAGFSRSWAGRKIKEEICNGGAQGRLAGKREHVFIKDYVP